jgi:hypothetical protein
VSPRRLARLDEIGVGELKSVGARRAAALGELGIATVLDVGLDERAPPPVLQPGLARQAAGAGPG